VLCPWRGSRGTRPARRPRSTRAAARTRRAGACACASVEPPPPDVALDRPAGAQTAGKVWKTNRAGRPLERPQNSDRTIARLLAEAASRSALRRLLSPRASTFVWTSTPVFHNNRYPYIDVRESRSDPRRCRGRGRHRSSSIRGVRPGSTLERVRLPDDLVARRRERHRSDTTVPTAGVEDDGGFSPRFVDEGSRRLSSPRRRR
jgi:hypothetical protein